MSPIVMLVDDDPMLAQVVTAGLEKESFNVVHCASPDEALEWLRLDRPDAMLLDVEITHCPRSATRFQL